MQHILAPFPPFHAEPASLFSYFLDWTHLGMSMSCKINKINNKILICNQLTHTIHFKLQENFPSLLSPSRGSAKATKQKKKFKISQDQVFFKLH
jgi:hypothetical protein